MDPKKNENVLAFLPDLVVVVVVGSSGWNNIRMCIPDVYGRIGPKQKQTCKHLYVCVWLYITYINSDKLSTLQWLMYSGFYSVHSLRFAIFFLLFCFVSVSFLVVLVRCWFGYSISMCHHLYFKPLIQNQKNTV